MTKDRRKFQRIKAPHLFKYKILKRKEILSPTSFIRDVSAGGARFFSEEYIPPESILELKIKFPMFNEPLPLLSKVVRVKTLSNGFEIGIEFIDLNENIRETIDQKIQEVYRIKKQKGGGTTMKAIGIIFILLAAIATLAMAVVQFRGGILFPSSSAAWLKVTQLCLLFSIAFSLLERKGE